MTKENSPVSKENYAVFLLALKNLSNAEKLACSSLVDTHLVKNYIADNPNSTIHEALRSILTELIEQLEEWSKIHGEILRYRFCEQKTIEEVVGHEIPIDYAPRTVSKKQKEGIIQLAAWFLEKEKSAQRKIISVSNVFGNHHVPEPIRFYLLEFPQFNVPINLTAQFVTTSQASFFSALRHLMSSLTKDDQIFATDYLSVDKSFFLYWVTEGLVVN